MGGGVFRMGKGMIPPTSFIRPEPEFSEEARKAKYQGDVRFGIVVDETGHPTAHPRT